MHRKIENTDQRALRLWLTVGLRIPEVVALKGDAGYLLNNMIAKYSLATDSYAISVGALTALEEMGVNLDRVYRRRKFYGKQNGKNPFIYEHATPAGVLRDALLSTEGDDEAILRILNYAGPVAVLLGSEDALLRGAGLNARLEYHPVGR